MEEMIDKGEMIYKFDNVEFSYGRKIDLKIDNLSFYKNKIYLLVGSNGSGKTTLMKILNGLLKIGSGELFYKNNPIEKNNFEKIRNETVYVHQNPYLFSGTVFYNLSYGLKIKNISKNQIDTKIDNILKRFDMLDFKYRKNRMLSIGEIQKIALARALVIEPEVIILDEPTANVDVKSIKIIENILYDLKQNGKTIIFSSHNSFFSYNFCDEVVNLENGRLLQK